MKITIGKKMKVGIALLIVALAAIFMLSPSSFGKYSDSAAQVQVTSSLTVSKDAKGKKKQDVYTFKRGSKEFQKIAAILDDASYHFTFKTFTNSSQFGQRSQAEMVLILDKNVLIFSNSGEIIINNRVYHVGYFGADAGQKMIKKINAVVLAKKK